MMIQINGGNEMFKIENEGCIPRKALAITMAEKITTPSPNEISNYYTGRHFFYHMEDLKNVDWNEGGHVHNWRRYVPDNVRDMWDTFTPKQKQALYEWADDIADNEEWE